MKVLHVVFGTIAIGGVGTYIRQINSALKDLGIEADVLSSDLHSTQVCKMNHNETFCFNHIRPMVYSKVLPTLYPRIQPLEVFRYIFEMGVGYLGIEGYDIIHCHDPISPTIIRRIMTEDQKKKVPIITTIHGSLFRELYLLSEEYQQNMILSEYAKTDKGKYFLKIECRGMENSQILLVQSRWIRDQMEENSQGVFFKKFRMVFGAVNIPFYLEQQKEGFHGVSHGKKVIAFTGRVEEIKRLDILIDALGHLQQWSDEWVCWIAGEGGLTDQLKLQASSLGIEKDVVFWGHVNNVPAFLKKADIYVQPSMQENQSFSVMEAQLAGIPVIVSNRAGLIEMVENEVTGYLFSWPNAKSLAERLYQLLQDDEIRTRVGNQAREWILKERCISKMRQNIKHVYEDASCSLQIPHHE